GVREERVLVGRDSSDISLPGAQWFYPNGDGAGFYRFALDDAALTRLVPVVQAALTAPERLALVGNQWTLAKAGKISIDQFFAMLAGFHTETDRAVLAAITERLYWINTNLVEDAARPAFERFLDAFSPPQFEPPGWDPRPTETADDRLRRATVIAALGELANATDIADEACQRLARYLEDPSSIDPNMASGGVGVAPRG